MMRDMYSGAMPWLWACPLVFVPPGTAVSFEPSPARAFDWNGTTACNGTDWPTPATPWLAMDRDGDGTITSGAELFGTGTELTDRDRAKHGFEALATLDENQDGRLTPPDPAWSSLVLWTDLECDTDENCLGERAAVHGEDEPRGRLVDVYLRCR